jgi:hypothetical protein
MERPLNGNTNVWGQLYTEFYETSPLINSGKAKVKKK